MSNGKPSEGLKQEMTQFQFTFCRDDPGSCRQNGCQGKNGMGEASEELFSRSGWR